MTQSPSTRGEFVSWDGGCLFVSKATAITGVHAHYAVQVALGSEFGIRFRPNDSDPWTAYDGVIIPSRQPHAMDATAVQSNAVLFVEPETREGRALIELYSPTGITPLRPDDAQKAAAMLFEVWRQQESRAALVDAAHRVIVELTHGVEPSVASDRRIMRATAYIQRHLSEPLTLERIAAEVFLSPSRFRHLFVAQTGMALRPYVLWRRFLLAWELLMHGESLSAAAHGAGFADAAHLTRTSRRMFGFPPSAMQMTRRLPPDDRSRPA